MSKISLFFNEKMVMFGIGGFATAPGAGYRPGAGPG